MNRARIYLSGTRFESDYRAPGLNRARIYLSGTRFESDCRAPSWNRGPLGTADAPLPMGSGAVDSANLPLLIESALPIIMKKLRIDPALAGSVILTTITDVVGIFAFLGTATLFLI